MLVTERFRRCNASERAGAVTYRQAGRGRNYRKR